ncbi:Pentatricopeptide repeat-containing protein [Symbiodinium microadriaticum]|uniref:Pentatricopeptide repeat-containing protein n=1 Tax=Symbiodinium microadriaticum TaxID=2951 RepID=A0A1Q9C820_SYMMI|nr:Pentatricopeptide repeat-containing protein [Symbiodinium microadriaticum]
MAHPTTAWMPGRVARRSCLQKACQRVGLLAGTIVVILGRGSAFAATQQAPRPGQPDSAASQPQQAESQRLAARGALLEAIKSLDRGFAATKENRSDVSGRIADLVRWNPTSDPTSKLGWVDESERTKTKAKLANTYDAPLREAKESWKHWEQVKKGRAELTGSFGSGLYKALTAMRQLRKSGSEVEEELRAALKGPASAKLLSEMEAIDLLPPVLQVLQAALMAAQLRRRDFAGVGVTASKLPEDSLTCQPEPKMRAILAAAAAQRGKLEEAVRQLERLPDSDSGPRFLTPSTAGQILLNPSFPQILSLANKEQRGAEVQAQLQRIGVQPLQDGKDSNAEMQRAVTTMKAYVKNKDLPNVTAVFNRLKKNGVVMRSQIYNCYLDACVQCHDIDAALSLFEEMKQLGFVDVVGNSDGGEAVKHPPTSSGVLQKVSYNTVLKEMTSRGLAANKVTYNELLNAKVAARDRVGMWSIVDQMLQAGLKANLITCSILLKSLTQHSAETDLARVLSLIDSVEEPIDEVLFSSIIEACIRIKRNISAPIYGAMIKAFGEAGHLHQVRELWAQLQSHNVKPTAITIGCVVEALVINKQGEEAWLQQAAIVNQGKSMINTVVYSTVLKGFAVSKRIDKVLAVYKEMRNNNIACNTITYNTMLDACAKCNAMEKASILLEDMRETNIEPDIITYSTIIKGYCLNGDVERALSVLEEMRRDGHFLPDEIMYNSILDGCTKQRNVSEALRLLDEMKASGIKPSNYTLSILVLGNARRLGQAMQMVEDLSSQNGLKPNIQVYTCLIHACFQNRRFERALSVYEKMIKEGCRADEKFYAVLARGCLQLHQPGKAMEVIRAAYNLPGSSLPSGPRAVGVEGLEELLQKIGKEEQELQVEGGTAPRAEFWSFVTVIDRCTCGGRAQPGAPPRRTVKRDRGGNWTLIYTDAPDIIGIPTSPFSTLGRIGQEIDANSGTIANVIEYRPSSFAVGIKDSVLEDAFVQRVFTDYKVASPTTVELNIRGLGLAPQRIFGVDVPEVEQARVS